MLSNVTDQPKSTVELILQITETRDAHQVKQNKQIFETLYLTEDLSWGMTVQNIFINKCMNEWMNKHKIVNK